MFCDVPCCVMEPLKVMGTLGRFLATPALLLSILEPAAISFGAIKAGSALFRKVEPKRA